MNNSTDQQHLDQKVAKLNRMAALLDSQFRVPFTQFRIGLDGIIGIVPFYGDVVSFLLSLWIIISIARMGVPAPILVRICFNSFMDFVIGLVPFFGDFADFFFKSNLKNVKLAQKYFERPKKVSAQSWLLIVSISLLIIGIFVTVVGTTFWLLFQLLDYLKTLMS